jgi:TRAP-type C4-dicarboxylate transport system permease small subunit
MIPTTAAVATALRRMPRYVLAAMMAVAIVNLLIGVFLRYVMTEVTDYFDWDMIRFTWVEEVGEFTLAWMTLIGAAIGIGERVHFTLHVGVDRLPLWIQRLIENLNALLIVGFGGIVAWQGWKISMLNTQLESPALSINLAWLYASSVVGGALIMLYGLALAFLPQRAQPGA